MKIKHLLLVLPMAILCIAAASAQDRKFSLSLGLDGGLPVSSGFKDIYSAAAGLTLRGQYNINEKIGLTLSSGAIGFFPKNFDGMDGEDGIDINAMLSIPVKAGGKYYITEKFYGMFELGVVSNRILVGGDDEDLNIGLSEPYSAFVYAPGIGLQLGGFDLGLRYESFSKGGSSSSFMGLRIGFNLFSIRN